VDFLRHGSGVRRHQGKTPDGFHHQGPDAPSAHRRPGYPLSGCVPAEPDSVSPSSVRLASTEQCGNRPSDTGAMPQKILLYRFPTEKRARSYPHALEKNQNIPSRDRVSPPQTSPSSDSSLQMTICFNLALMKSPGGYDESCVGRDSQRQSSRAPRTASETEDN
jgi:hypothetical protein